jgi:hypothetical protein
MMRYALFLSHWMCLASSKQVDISHLPGSINCGLGNVTKWA